MSEDKVAELLRRKAERAEKAEAELQALKMEALELEEKYETSGQRLGIDFAVLTTLVGNFVVRKPEFTVAKKFSDVETKGAEEVIQFVDPCVLFPPRESARAVFQEHAGVAWRLAACLMKLYEADAGIKAGK